MEKQLKGETLMRPGSAEELFARVGLSCSAKEAYVYSQKIGLYKLFCGMRNFGLTCGIFPRNRETRPSILAMAVDGDNRTSFEVGAKVLSGEKTYGYCLFRQDYGIDSYCVMSVYLEGSEPRFFEVIVNGVDFCSRPSRASFCFEPGLPGDELTIIQTLERCGWRGDVEGKVCLDDVEKLMRLMADGRLLSTGRESVQEVMCRIGDLLVQTVTKPKVAYGGA